MPRSLPCTISAVLIILSSACSVSTITGEDPVIKAGISASIRQYSSVNWESRRNAIITASEYTDSSYRITLTRFFIKAADDSHPLVRIEALRGLKKMMPPEAMPKIRHMAQYDNSPIVRWTAYTVLEDYRDAENEKAFITGCGDEDWLIRESAIRGLLKIEDMEVQRRNIDLILTMIKDSSISVRIETLNNLQYRDPVLFSAISRLINSRKTGKSLLKAALRAVSGYRFDDLTRKRLVRLLTHENKEIRILALRALKKEKDLEEDM